MTDKCVHTEHCCVIHGCKWDDMCPVVNKEKEQSFPCEDCDFEGVNNVAEAIVLEKLRAGTHVLFPVNPTDKTNLAIHRYNSLTWEQANDIHKALIEAVEEEQ